MSTKRKASYKESYNEKNTKDVATLRTLINLHQEALDTLSNSEQIPHEYDNKVQQIKKMLSGFNIRFKFLHKIMNRTEIVELHRDAQVFQTGDIINFNDVPSNFLKSLQEFDPQYHKKYMLAKFAKGKKNKKQKKTKKNKKKETQEKKI